MGILYSLLHPGKWLVQNRKNHKVITQKAWRLYALLPIPLVAYKAYLYTAHYALYVRLLATITSMALRYGVVYISLWCTSWVIQVILELFCKSKIVPISIYAYIHSMLLLLHLLFTAIVLAYDLVEALLGNFLNISSIGYMLELLCVYAFSIYSLYFQYQAYVYLTQASKARLVMLVLVIFLLAVIYEC